MPEIMAVVAAGAGCMATSLIAAPMFDLPSATPIPCSYPNLRKASNSRLQPSKRVFRRVTSAEENDAALRWVLQRFWGHKDFRGPQLSICKHVVGGCDVLVIAPTGLGKSVCFQVPALTLKYGVTIVTSPLVALMQDQVSSMQARLLHAGETSPRVAMLYEKTTQDEIDQIKKQLTMGHPQLRLLYTTPESLMGSKISNQLLIAYKAGQIARLVVDEAHVIEDWGMSFRPLYRQALSEFRGRYPEVPITALTASATEEVRYDIVTTLGITGVNFVKWIEPFNRKNLFYEVKYHNRLQRDDKYESIAQYITKYREEARQRNIASGISGEVVCGIVYCWKVNDCLDLAKYLSKNGVNARPFHAGIPDRQKRETMEEWKSGQIECVVATIAFGMGIDAPHVRYVVHHEAPNSFQGYYQETGRAGRDGHISRCVVYYSREEGENQRQLRHKSGDTAANNIIKIRENKLAEAGEGPMSDEEKDAIRTKHLRGYESIKALHLFLEDIGTCRHIGICRYFGESIDSEDPAIVKAYCDGMCDHCVNKVEVRLRAEELNEDFDPPSPVRESTTLAAPGGDVCDPARPPDSFLQLDASFPSKSRRATESSVSSAVRSIPTLATRMIANGPLVLKTPELVRPPSFFPSASSCERSPSLTSTNQRATSSKYLADDEASVHSPSIVSQRQFHGVPPLVGSTGTQPVMTDDTPTRAPISALSRRKVAQQTQMRVERARSTSLTKSTSGLGQPRIRPVLSGVMTTDDVDADDSGNFARKGKMPLDPQKRQRQEDEFMAVKPADASAGGPFPYYGGIDGVKRARAGMSQKEFRPPLMPVPVPHQSHAGMSAKKTNPTPASASMGRSGKFVSDLARDKARAAFQAEIDKLLIKGPKADAWWIYILPTEPRSVDRQQTVDVEIKRVEREVAAELVLDEDKYKFRMDKLTGVITRLRQSDFLTHVGTAGEEEHALGKWAGMVKGWFHRDVGEA